MDFARFLVQTYKKQPLGLASKQQKEKPTKHGGRKYIQLSISKKNVYPSSVTPPTVMLWDSEPGKNQL
jgi:hypothetical protein